jgi:hypothetical protein
MTQSDLETTIRDYLNEPDVNGRFSSAVVTRSMNRAQDATALLIFWPYASVPGTWNTNLENPLIEDMLSVKEVKVNGQICVPTDVPLLQGTQIEMYDQSGKNQTPEWLALDRAAYTNPATYPVTATQGVTGYPISMIPGQPPSRPAYYIRGANLGIIPTPVSGSTVTIGYIQRPIQLSATVPTGISIYPEIFRDCIAFKSCQLLKASDRKFDEANEWRDMWKEEVVKLRYWKNQLSPVPERPQPITYRTYFGGDAIPVQKWLK